MMSTTLPVFQKTLAKTDLWLTEIMDLLDWEDPQHAYKALRTVLHVLRDHLTVEEASDFAAQLPMLIRGLYYDGWNPSHVPRQAGSYEEFVGLVNNEFPPTADDGYIESKDISCAVFTVITNHVSQGEIRHIIGSLPVSVRELWPA